MSSAKKRILPVKKFKLVNPDEFTDSHSVEPPSPKVIGVYAQNQDGSMEQLMDLTNTSKSPSDTRNPLQKKIEKTPSLRVTLGDGSEIQVTTDAGLKCFQALSIYESSREAFHELGNLANGMGFSYLIGESEVDLSTKKSMSRISELQIGVTDEFNKVMGLPKQAKIVDSKKADEIIDAVKTATKNARKNMEEALTLSDDVDGLTSENGEYLDEMKKSLKIGLKVAENHLKLIEGKPVSENLEEVSLNEVVSDTAHMLAINKTMNRNVGVSTNLDGSNPTVMADWDNLQRVLINLGKNGVHSCDKRHKVKSLPNPQVIFETSSVDDAAIIKIIDNGLGFKPGDEDKLFTRGYTTKGQEGNGLGLAISREIVERYDGEISAKSLGPLLGAEFTIKFPKS